jgi:YVTN family beta-propeller protein
MQIPLRDTAITIRRAAVPCVLFYAGILAFAAGLAQAQVPSPAIVVLSEDTSSLAIIDVRARKIVGRVSTGLGPHEVAASDDGKLAFVTNYGLTDPVTPGDSISVIDLAARKELRRVRIGTAARPHGITYSGGKVYFTAEGFKMIGRYDPARDQIDWMMGNGQDRTHMLVLDRDGNRIFASNVGSDSIAAMERIPETPDWDVTVIPVGKAPMAIDLSPDGREVWTAHTADGGVSVVDAATKKVLQTLQLGTKRTNRLKFTPDGRHVLLTDRDGGELLVLDAATRKLVKRIPVGRRPSGILIVPDGSVAYVAVQADNNLTMIDLKTLEITGRVPTDSNPDGMAWVEAR